MEEKAIPWWRRALKFALGGIRSGFGLFSRAVKAETETEAEFLESLQQRPEAETALTESIPQTEEVAVEATAAETLAEADPVDGPVVVHGPFEQEAAEVDRGPVEPVEQAAEKLDARHALYQGTASAVPQVQQKNRWALAPEGRFPPISPAPSSLSAVCEAAEPVAVVEIASDAEPEAVEAPEAEVESESKAIPDVAAALQLAVVPAPELLAEAEDEPAINPVVEAVAEPEPDPEPVPVPIEVIEAVEEAMSSDNEPEDEDHPEVEAGIETEAEPVEAAEAMVDAEPEVTAAPAPVPDAAPPMVLTTEPTADEKAVKIAEDKAVAKLVARQKWLDESAEQSPFSVFVGQVYDGPLDLLLDLIRKQDIDIYDIPIAKITAQFLAYVNQLKASDVDVAGEFIYTASLLIHIKSKMLLPRADAGPEEAAEDPRRELVERLLEHERFKNAAQMLQQKQMLEAATWSNPGAREFKDDEDAEPEIAADTVDLVRIFRDILERARTRPVLDVSEDTVTVGQMIQFLTRRLTMEDKPVALRRLLIHTRSERALIAIFLALLELVRMQAVLLRQDRHFSEIFIKKNAEFDAVVGDGLTNAQDDWR